MRIDRIFKLSFWKFELKQYKEMLKIDEVFNATFRGEHDELSFKEKHSIEYKTVKLYRKYQVNHGNAWGYYYRYLLERMSKKTGVDFLGNPNIGKGLIIGHWGRIVINGNATFGDEIFLTHGVTIGRDIRGKRAGAPHFCNRIVIRTNSTIVGNVTIGNDVLIAPNTFVNFDVPDHSIVIGNPATIHHKDNATEGHIGRLSYE